MNQEAVPIWVADYVLGSYGSGAIMAVPAHDARDYDFALQFGLPVRQVVQPQAPSQDPPLPFTGHPTALLVHPLVRQTVARDSYAVCYGNTVVLLTHRSSAGKLLHVLAVAFVHCMQKEERAAILLILTQAKQAKLDWCSSLRRHHACGQLTP